MRDGGKNVCVNVCVCLYTYIPEAPQASSARCRKPESGTYPSMRDKACKNLASVWGLCVCVFV